MPGIGEKTAASLVGEFGTPRRLLVASGYPGNGMSATARSKLEAAAD